MRVGDVTALVELVGFGAVIREEKGAAAVLLRCGALLGAHLNVLIYRT